MRGRRLAPALGLLVWVAAGPPSAAAAPAPVSSPSWAGYAVTAPVGVTTSFTDVHGRWTEPAVTCGAAAAGASSAIWVGLGGFVPGTSGLEQIGTTAQCDSKGVQRHSAWFELWPYPSYPIRARVRPGDAIAASVQVTGVNVRLHLQDLTRRWNVTKTIASIVPDLSSAEWIVEAPQTCVKYACTPTPLADFGSLTMTDLSAATAEASGALVSSPWAVSAISLVPGQPLSYGSNDGSALSPGNGPATDPAARGAAAPAAIPAQPSADGGSFAIDWRGLPH